MCCPKDYVVVCCCCLQQLDSANARRPHMHANAYTRWLVISPRTHTRSPRCFATSCTRCTSERRCMLAATVIQQTQCMLSPAHPRLNTLHLASISLASTSDAALRPSFIHSAGQAHAVIRSRRDGSVSGWFILIAAGLAHEPRPHATAGGRSGSDSRMQVARMPLHTLPLFFFVFTRVR
jgi:hypothetical protein